MYLTYAQYKLYGGTLDETTFNDMAFEAASIVDWYTFNRLQNMTEEYPEALQRCMYKLIQLIQTLSAVSGTGTPESAASSSAGIASQSNDGVSISYNILSASEIVNNSNAKSKQIVEMYLSNVTDSLGRRVLYRGVYPNE